MLEDEDWEGDGVCTSGGVRLLLLQSCTGLTRLRSTERHAGQIQSSFALLRLTSKT